MSSTGFESQIGKGVSSKLLVKGTARIEGAANGEITRDEIVEAEIVEAGGLPEQEIAPGAGWEGVPDDYEPASESLIGEGAKVSGRLFFSAPARIEGEAEGEITGDEIVIAERAIVAARVTALRVRVAGTLSGEIIASERVELLKTARVQCSISTPRLVLAEGAIFDGECFMSKKPSGPGKAAR